jgi:hypothetical protein
MIRIDADPSPFPPPAGFGVQPHIGVATVAASEGSALNLHDRRTRDRLAARIAGLLGIPCLGPHEPGDAAAGALYIVPGDTLTAAEARVLGIADATRLFGGVVPDAFVATKAITHGVVAPDAARPQGWSTAMASALEGVALRGFTAFTPGDARRAGRTLLSNGPVRIKQVRGKAGLGQSVAHDAAALDAVIAGQDADEIAAFGIVLEEDLADVVTHSVGTARIGAAEIAYWGTQNLTRNHRGEAVYGGSALSVVRGDLDTLHDRAPDPLVAHVVAQARAYDRAAHAAYPGLFASRRNYDVIEGTDAAGVRRVAVLEQSWRVGGASGAEIAAMEAFAADPRLDFVRAATVEIHGRDPAPAGATVYFEGVDPVVGPITKYAMLTA